VAIFAAAALVSGIFLLSSGLVRSIKNGEDWPPMRTGDGKAFSIDESSDFPADAIDEVNISLRFEDASITEIDGDRITVRYHGTVRSSRSIEDIFNAEQSGSVLILESLWDNISVHNSNIVLDVGIPFGSVGKLKITGASGNYLLDGLSLETLEGRASSGGITAHNISADSVELKASSGTVSVENWTVGKAVIESSSGSLKLHTLTVRGSLDLNASSGTITGDEIEASSINAAASSGNIKLIAVSGSAALKSSSGSIDIEFRKPGELIDINATSGRIEVALPAGTDFMLEARASSGDIRSDFPVAISGSINDNRLEGQAGSGGSRTVTLQSSSGNIILKQIPVS